MNIPKIRVDDFPQGIPDRRYTKEDLKLLIHLEERRIPYILGVVPFLINKLDADFLNSLNYTHFAMHGFDHSVPRWRPGSEFDRRGSRENGSRMNTSFEIFNTLGIDIHMPRIFIPPFNMFNQDIVNVLNEKGFEYITGGPETYSQMDLSKINLGRLKLITSQGKFYTSNGNLDEILSYTSELPENQSIVLHLNGEYKWSGQ